MTLNPPKTELIQWVNNRIDDLSDWNQLIFNYGETAWREYKSSAWYVERLRTEGFTVEPDSGGIDGSRWQAPLCDYAAPINFRWPEYVSTERGHEWWIPG